MTNVSSRRVKFFLGSALATFIILLLKALFLSRKIYEAEWKKIFFGIVHSDILYVIAVLILCVAASLINRRSLQGLLRFSVILLNVHYATDTALIVALDTRLHYVQVYRFASEWRIILTFLSGTGVATILSFIVLQLLTVQLSVKKILPFALIPILLLSIIPTFTSDRYSNLLNGYGIFAVNPFSAHLHLQPSRDRYSSKEIASALSHYKDTPLLTLPESEPDIVVVMSESLSSVDSHLLSGIHDRLPLFDKMAEQGTLFRNFFSTFEDTEGAGIALLTGMSVIPFPGGSNNKAVAYSNHPSVVRLLEQQGYLTEFLTATPLSFEDQGDLFTALGFDRVSGKEEVERFKQSRVFTFDSPPDAVLFDEALSRLDGGTENQKPKFLFLLTTSGHEPYVDPNGQYDSEENVWHYVDAEMYSLYESLEARGFFENGLLMILGDHRKRSPIEAGEWRVFGESAKARVPLLIIGRGVQRGVVDERLFQGSDVFPMLVRALTTRDELSQHATFVEFDSTQYFGGASYGELEIFSEKRGLQGSFHATVDGTELRWTTLPPDTAAPLEKKIHWERAASQYYFSTRPSTCDMETDSQMINYDDRGLLVRTYSGTDIRGRLVASSSRFIASSSVPYIDFPHMDLAGPKTQSDFAMEFLGFLLVESDGPYQFRVESDDGACLAIDRNMVVDANVRRATEATDGETYLGAGAHQINLRYFQSGGDKSLRLLWRSNESGEWSVVPKENFRPPRL